MSIDDLAINTGSSKIDIANYLDEYKTIECINELELRGGLLCKFIVMNDGIMLTSCTVSEMANPQIIGSILFEVFKGKSQQMIVDAMQKFTQSNPELEDICRMIISKWADLIEVNDSRPIVRPSEAMSKYAK